MISINMKILIANVAICTFFILSFAQYAFADEALCGIGRDITTSERKETYQQADQITSLINTATGALSNILGGGGDSGTKVPKEILEQLFSLLKTLTNFEKMQIAQGYVCIPQTTYFEIRDNLTTILSELY